MCGLIFRMYKFERAEHVISIKLYKKIYNINIYYKYIRILYNVM